MRPSTAKPQPPKKLPPRPWAPLSDAEYAALAACLPAMAPGRRRRGRPPADPRRTLDAIFWVACSTGPWRQLPAHLGRGDSAHRALRRWMAAGVLEIWLAKALRARRAGAAVIGQLAYWLARAFRRMARLVGWQSIGWIRRIGAVDAWPANELVMPDRILSETAKKQIDSLAECVRLEGRSLGRSARRRKPWPIWRFRERLDIMRAALRASLATWRVMRVGVCGNRSDWRLK
jgi:transposase